MRTLTWCGCWVTGSASASPANIHETYAAFRRRFDHVITLCDKARETTPEFPHHPQRTHWSIPDPTTDGGTEQARYAAFERTLVDIDTRIRHLLPALTSAH